LSTPHTEAHTLAGRLAQIRSRLQARIDDSLFERWVDAAALLELQGEEFVRTAYLRLFGREPDGAGLRHHTDQLVSGHVTKLELLTALANSPEGRHYRVRFTGMAALPVQHPFESTPGKPTDQFVREVSRYYNGREPAEDSLARWVELLETRCLTREQVVHLFAESARGYRLRPLPDALDELTALSSTLAEMKQELDWHQRAVESLLPPRR
jgi:hypothetical protein